MQQQQRLFLLWYSRCHHQSPPPGWILQLLKARLQCFLLFFGPGPPIQSQRIYETMAGVSVAASAAGLQCPPFRLSTLCCCCFDLFRVLAAAAEATELYTVQLVHILAVRTTQPCFRADNGGHNSSYNNTVQLNNNTNTNTSYSVSASTVADRLWLLLLLPIRSLITRRRRWWCRLSLSLFILAERKRVASSQTRGCASLSLSLSLSLS